MACNIQSVPNRLHKNDRPIIAEFVVGEELYRRCNPDELENPFNISICEVSHNRQGLPNNVISERDDVLYNIKDGNPEKYEKVVCVLTVRDVCAESATYNKTFTHQKETEEYVARMMLLHDPAECMYPHCVFRVWVNGELINTFPRYKEVFKGLKPLQTMLKQALTSMILQRQISQELN